MGPSASFQHLRPGLPHRTEVRRGVWLVLLLAFAGCERPAFDADQESSPTQGSLEVLRPPLPPAPRARTNTDVVDPSAPEGFLLASVVGVTDTERGQAIVLQAGQRALPIFVGESEGLSIQLRLSGERFHRPLTHDLMDTVLEELGGTIVSVRVDRYEEEIFYSVIVLEHETERRELDSRTSDAIALALGHRVPIYVRTSVLDSGSVDLRSLRPDAEEPAPSGGPPGSQDSGTPPLEPGIVAL